MMSFRTNVRNLKANRAYKTKIFLGKLRSTLSQIPPEACTEPFGCAQDKLRRRFRQRRSRSFVAFGLTDWLLFATFALTY